MRDSGAFCSNVHVQTVSYIHRHCTQITAPHPHVSHSIFLSRQKYLAGGRAFNVVFTSCCCRMGTPTLIGHFRKTQDRFILISLLSASAISIRETCNRSCSRFSALIRLSPVFITPGHVPTVRAYFSGISMIPGAGISAVPTEFTKHAYFTDTR